MYYSYPSNTIENNAKIDLITVSEIHFYQNINKFK